MDLFDIRETNLHGAFLIRNFFSGDNRGGFTKCYEKDFYRKHGITFELNETFFSYSSRNVIRGLHFQTNHPQSKIVSVISGGIWDVIVDLRVGSPTFNHWYAEELSSENHMSFYIPGGFAHGFLSLQEGTIVLYQCDGRYDKENDTGILYNDADIGIDWPIDLKQSIHSDRDLKLMSMQEYLKNPMVFKYGSY